METRKAVSEGRHKVSFEETTNVTNARKDLYNLVESVSLYHEPVRITGKKTSAVLISEEDWRAIQETLSLDSIPGMTKSILEGAREPFRNCIPDSGEEAENG